MNCRFIIYFSVTRVWRVFIGQKKKYFPQLKNCMVIYLDNFLLHRPFFFFFCFVIFVIDCTYIFGNIMQSL